jgi:hypothetical protein
MYATPHRRLNLDAIAPCQNRHIHVTDIYQIWPVRGTVSVMENPVPINSSCCERCWFIPERVGPRQVQQRPATGCVAALCTNGPCRDKLDNPPPHIRKWCLFETHLPRSVRHVQRNPPFLALDLMFNATTAPKLDGLARTPSQVAVPRPGLRGDAGERGGGRGRVLRNLTDCCFLGGGIHALCGCNRSPVHDDGSSAVWRQELLCVAALARCLCPSGRSTSDEPSCVSGGP